MLVAVGYFFGNVFDTLAGPFKVAFVLLAVVFIVAAIQYINRYLVKTEI